MERGKDRLSRAKNLSEGVIFDSLPGIFYLFDDKGRFLQWNKNCEKVSGYSADEISKMNPIDFFTEKDKKHMAGMIQEVFTNGKAVTEANLLTKDGREIPFFFTGSHVNLDNISCLVGMGVGITERKRAEDALKQSEEKFRSFFKNATDAIFLVDEEGRYIDANEKTFELSGYSKKELLEKTVKDLLLPGTSLEIFSKILRGEPASGEFNLLRKDGTLVPVELKGAQIKIGEKKIVQGIVRDITERKQAERVLKSHVRQQAAVAELGQRALSTSSLDALMNDAVALVTQRLNVEYSKVLELLPGDNEMLLRAGVGWKDGLVGSARVNVGASSQAGYTLLSSTPVTVEDLRNETRFSGPPLLTDHGIVSGISVIIPGRDHPVGILGAHTTKRRTFTEDDNHFVQAVANVIAAAIERKQAEDALQESEKRIRNTLDSLGSGVSLINRDMEIVWLNKTFSKWFPGIDVRRRQICYESIYLPPREQICEYCPAVKTFEDGRVHSAETEVCADGNIYLITAAPILDKNGQTTLVIETVVNITERKIVEGTIRESEGRYRDLFDNVNDGIVTVDMAGDITYFNEKFADMFGHQVEELVGKNISDIIHPDDRLRVLERYKKRYMGKDVPSIYDFKGLKKSGEIVYIEANTSMIKSGKKIIGTRVILRDITERKQAEDALKGSEERYRILFENANDAIFIADTDTEKLLFVNKMAEKLTGRNREELIGTHRSELHPKEKAAYYKKQFKEHVESGGVIDAEGEVTKKDGTIVPVLISASVFEIEGKKIIQSIFRDITERRTAEDELLGKFLRYRIKKGEVYLIEEQNPDLSAEVFKDLLECGFSGTIFSRAKKEDVEELFGKVKSFWLAENIKADDVLKPRFFEIESQIKTLGTGNNAVLLDRMDYLMSKNGFEPTLKFVQGLFERAYHQRLVVILVLDPKTLRPIDLQRLKKETRKAEPKVKSQLPRDIYEILKFVYGKNRVGEYPSYKNIHEEFKITRTTARSRIKKLKAMKFLIVRKSGRAKVIETTEEGREQF